MGSRGDFGRSRKRSTISPSSWNSGANTWRTSGRFSRNSMWLLNSDFKFSRMSISDHRFIARRALSELPPGSASKSLPRSSLQPSGNAEELLRRMQTPSSSLHIFRGQTLPPSPVRWPDGYGNANADDPDQSHY